MINGEFKKWHKHWNDKTLKVERSHHAYDKNDEKTDPIIIDIEEYSEEESDTEEVDYQDYSYDDYYTWEPFCEDNTLTMNSEGNVEITLTHVKRRIVGYNEKGMLEEEKPKPKTIKII